MKYSSAARIGTDNTCTIIFFSNRYQPFSQSFVCKMHLSSEWNKRSPTINVTLQVYLDGIVLLDLKKKQIVERYRINQIRRFVAQKKFVLIDCGSHRDGHLVLESKKRATDITKVLDDNIEKLSKAIQKAASPRSERKTSKSGDRKEEERSKELERQQEREREMKREREAKEKEQRERDAREKAERDKATRTPSPPLSFAAEASGPLPDPTKEIILKPSKKEKRKQKKALKKKKSKGTIFISLCSAAQSSNLSIYR